MYSNFAHCAVSKNDVALYSPGISAGVTWDQPATQVDMAPTFLGLAGIPKPAQMDGKSLVPLLISAEAAAAGLELSESTRIHLGSLLPVAAYRQQWRDAAFIEYYYVEYVVNCMPST